MLRKRLLGTGKIKDRKETITIFRFRKSLPMGYDRQGYIYFTSKMYNKISKYQQRIIVEICRTAGGEYEKALFEYVTTNATDTEICEKHHLSESTLKRAVKKYYCLFPTR